MNGRNRLRNLGVNGIMILKWISEFLATDPEVPGSISGTTRFSEK
jgi:hypothetical protein